MAFVVFKQGKMYRLPPAMVKDLTEPDNVCL